MGVNWGRGGWWVLIGEGRASQLTVFSPRFLRRSTIWNSSLGMSRGGGVSFEGATGSEFNRSHDDVCAWEPKKKITHTHTHTHSPGQWSQPQGPHWCRYEGGPVSPEMPQNMRVHSYQTQRCKLVKECTQHVGVVWWRSPQRVTHRAGFKLHVYNCV